MDGVDLETCCSTAGRAGLTPALMAGWVVRCAGWPALETVRRDATDKKWAVLSTAHPNTSFLGWTISENAAQQQSCSYSRSPTRLFVLVKRKVRRLLGRFGPRHGDVGGAAARLPRRISLPGPIAIN